MTNNWIENLISSSFSRLINNENAINEQVMQFSEKFSTYNIYESDDEYDSASQSANESVS